MRQFGPLVIATTSMLWRLQACCGDAVVMQPLDIFRRQNAGVDVDVDIDIDEYVHAVADAAATVVVVPNTASVT